MFRPTVDQASKQNIGDSDFVNLVVRWREQDNHRKSLSLVVSQNLISFSSSNNQFYESRISIHPIKGVANLFNVKSYVDIFWVLWINLKLVIGCSMNWTRFISCLKACFIYFAQKFLYWGLTTEISVPLSTEIFCEK